MPPLRPARFLYLELKPFGNPAYGNGFSMGPKEQSPVENAYKRIYVVRVYRRRDEPPGSLVGVLEEVSTGRSIPFRTGVELLAVLFGGDRRDGDPSMPGGNDIPD